MLHKKCAKHSLRTAGKFDFTLKDGSAHQTKRNTPTATGSCPSQTQKSLCCESVCFCKAGSCNLALRQMALRSLTLCKLVCASCSALKWLVGRASALRTRRKGFLTLRCSQLNICAVETVGCRPVQGLLLPRPGFPGTRRPRPRPRQQQLCCSPPHLLRALPRLVQESGRPMICGGGCSTFRRTYSWGSWERKACAAASPAAPAPTRSARPWDRSVFISLPVTARQLRPPPVRRPGARREGRTRCKLHSGCQRANKPIPTCQQQPQTLGRVNNSPASGKLQGDKSARRASRAL